MPEVLFRVRFPDGSRRDCYSPSTVVHDYLQAGRVYPVPEFLARTRDALQAASRRVQQKYGFACSRSADELALIELLAARFRDDGSAAIEVESMTGDRPAAPRSTENRT